MLDFTFQNATKIIFGRDTQGAVGAEVKPFAKSVLLVYGSDRIKDIGLYGTVVKSLEEHGIAHFDLPGVQPNPRLKHVNEGIKLARDNKVDFILAVGGGSVIDSAKAIAIGVPYDGDVWDLFNGEPILEALPIGAVLTYPAAGGEASAGTVVTNEDGWYKRPTGAMCMRPKFAIMNPELTLSLPKGLTAIGVADIMAHLMERYFTRVENTVLIDGIIETMLRTIMQSARMIMENPSDYDARAELMLASTFAHNDLCSCGRITDWGSHDIEHELSGIYDIAHGTGLAIVMPAWMTYVHPEAPERFAAFARNVMGVENSSDDDAAVAMQGIAKLRAFFEEIGLPTYLSQIDIDDSRLSEMARKGTEKHPLGNFKKLHEADVFNILTLAK